MSAGSPPVAVITGASQGIGASLATAYREIGHAVVGTSRTIEASGDPMVVTVQGDNADPDTAERVVSPGVVRTPMHPAEAYEGLGALHPMGRLGEVDDVVRAVMYLEAAPFVTGEFLHVDGGQSAGHWHPDFHAELLPTGGAEWQIVRPSGSSVADIRTRWGPTRVGGRRPSGVSYDVYLVA